MAETPTTPLPRPPAANPDSGRWVYVVFLAALGGVFGWFAWSQADTYLALRGNGQRAEAVVAGHQESRGRRSTTWYPVFRFATADGRSVEATSGVSADPAALPRGRRVAVVYDPANPANVRQAADMEAGPGATPWILGVLAVLMFAAAGAFLLPRRRA